LASYQSDPTYGAAGHLRVATNHPLNFWTNNTKRVTIDATGNVGIKTATPGAVLDINGPTIKMSTQFPEYRYRTGGSTDTDWKTIINILQDTSIYSCTSLEIDLISSPSNHGNTPMLLPMKFTVSARRSSGELNNLNDGLVSGYTADYVRLVKTATGVYEVQVRQVASYTNTDFKARVISSSGASITYVDSPANGSAGTIYTATPLHWNYFTNIVAAGNIQAVGDIYSVALTDYSGTSTIVGWSSRTTFIYYKKIGKTVIVYFYIYGTSNAATTSFTLPFTAKTIAGMVTSNTCKGQDGGTSIAGGVSCAVGSASNVLVFSSTQGAQETGGWTATDGKAIEGQFTYEAA